MDIDFLDYFRKMNDVLRYTGKNAPVMLSYVDNAWNFVIMEGVKRKVLATGVTVEDLVKDFYKKHPEGYKP